jgi:hypothetical protein
LLQHGEQVTPDAESVFAVSLGKALRDGNLHASALGVDHRPLKSSTDF